MPLKQTAPEMLNREFLEIRCRLIDIASAMDRVDRRDGSEQAARDPRYAKIIEALGLIATGGSDRAERVQMLFSDPYQADWRG